jgi:oxaloacetate decarboxylase alpha subunit
MSMTYGHSPTETIVSIMQETERDTGFDIEPLEDIAAYFREARKKYAKFEGSLRGVDSRILIAQVPGGMLTSMEGQLREQNAPEKFDEVLAEIPRVREDLGFIPLVTPTSQIIGTQAVLNVLTGERYKNISKETAGVLKGEYGVTPAPVNKELQQKVLDGGEAITCRPADLLEPEMDGLRDELREIAATKSIKLNDGESETDDVLIYALFQQIGLRFLENRNNPEAFEPHPSQEAAGIVIDSTGNEVYTVEVEGKSYTVKVANGGDIIAIAPASSTSATAVSPNAAPVGTGEAIPAPLAGNVFKVEVVVGQQVSEGDTIIILEAMKMETSISAPRDGTVASIVATEGSSVSVGDTLLALV